MASPDVACSIFEGSQQLAGVHSDPNYMEIAARLISILKFREKALDRLPIAYFRADRRIGDELLVRRPSRQLADSGPLKRRTSADGIEPSRCAHSSLRSAHRTVARYLCGSHLDCIQRAGCIALRPLRLYCVG